MTTYLVEGLGDGALRIVQALFPGCSAAAAIMHTGTTLSRIGVAGPHGVELLQGAALHAGYGSMRERCTQRSYWENGEGCLLSLPILGNGRSAIGVLQVLTASEPDAAQLDTLEATTRVIRDAVWQSKLNKDLQHSLNQLFLVHQVGSAFTLSTSLDLVLTQVRDQLAGTLNLRHCCILLLHESRYLTREAGIGIDQQWLQDGRLPLARSLARAVLESGAAEQVTDLVELGSLDLPSLDTGALPAGVLCVPLSTRMGVIGFLELYTPTPYAFSSDEVFLLSILGAEVAMAVENAGLYESLREKEGRLTVLAHKLIHTQEEERRRIARDMHDGLAQMIVSAFQLLQAHAFTLPQGADRQSLDRGLAMLAECIDESREVIYDLRPSTLDDFGLILAMRQLLVTLSSEHDWQMEFSAEGQIGTLSSAMETAVFRLVQETLTNVRKHAQSARVRMRVCAAHGSLVITVRDWGIGFDPARASTRQNGHLGLMGMKERVSLLNGRFYLHSRPAAGTLVRITIPID